MHRLTRFPYVLALIGLCCVCLLGCRAPGPDPATPGEAAVEESAPESEALPTLAPTITPADDPLSGVSPTTPAGDRGDRAAPTEALPTTAPSADPSATPKLAPSPEATMTPRVTPVPTPIPPLDVAAPPVVARLTAAGRATEDGDLALAISLWEEAWGQAPAPQRAASGISLARAYIEASRHQDAISLLAQVISETTSAPAKGEALGLLATSYEAVGAWREALDAFTHYLQFEPTTVSYVRWHMARAYEALKEDVHAAEQLMAIDLSAQAPAQRAETLEELAAVRRRLRDYDGALESYRRILDFAERADYRALILQRQGETLRDAGRGDEAVKVFNQVLQEYHSSPVALYALQALDGLNAAQVDDLERGQLLLGGGQPGPALEALQRYLAAHPNEQVTQVHFDLGQAYEDLGRYAEAFQEYDLLIEKYPQDALASEAWWAKARAEKAHGGDPSGIYQGFARRYPQHPRAAEAIWLAAVGLERGEHWQLAGDLYHALRTSYPNDRRVVEALFREGLMAYARQDINAALTLWSEALQGQLSSEERARRLVWAGLAEKGRGDQEAAQRYWQDAIAKASSSYWGLRARDLSAAIPLRLPENLSYAVPDSRPSPKDWEAIAGWVNALPVAEGALGATVAQDPLLQCGTALWRLGWEEDAVNTYRALRDKAWDNDPPGLMALMRAFDDLGVHMLTISTADRLLALGRKAGAPEAPPALLKLAYPTTYGHLISAEGQKQRLDPLLFLALVRQESRFDPHAISYAGASGLTQVMPDTGTWIASQLGDTDYRQEMIFRPIVGVRYGVYYLAAALNQNDRNWIAALVAYNAGPGNLQRWSHGKPISDLDLFYEMVPVDQTRDYIRLIYQQYRIYEALYGPSAPVRQDPG